MIDHSGSTRTDPHFNDTLRQVGKVYLSILHAGRENEVSIQHGGVKNEVVYDGKGVGLIGLRDRLDTLANGKGDGDHDAEHHDADHDDPDRLSAAGASHSRRIPIMVDPHGAADGLANGSPIVETLLSPALAWINDRPKQNQKLVIILSDLIADPTKYRS